MNIDAKGSAITALLIITLAAISAEPISAAPEPVTPAASEASAQPRAAVEKESIKSIEATAPAPVAKAEDLLVKIKDLVVEFYPRAKITADEKSLHFEDKVKQENGYYSSKPELAPKEGGVLGDVALHPGEYTGTAKTSLNSEVPNGFYSVLTMAPYSGNRNEHLLARLLFPSDASEEFKQRFKDLVNKYNADDPYTSPRRPDKSSTSATAAPATVPSQAAIVKQTEPPKPVEIPKPAGYDATVKLFSQKKWALAQKGFEKFAKTGYDEANTHAYLAYCFYNQRQYTKALREFAYVTDHSPHNLTLQRSAEGSVRKLRSYMTGICPMDCLKANDPRWHARPDGSKWMRFSLPNGWCEYSTAHMGDIISYEHGAYIDKGKCPVCGGSGTVPIIHDGDPLP